MKRHIITYHNTSSSRILRLAALLLLLAMLPLCAGALELKPWGGGTVAPEGSGTQNDPYIVSSAQNLYYIQAHSTMWGANKYFRQTDDISLDNSLWEPIGIGTSSGGFFGHYDGGGYVISDAVIDWCGASADASACKGFFGFVSKGSLRNIHLRNIHLTCSTGSTPNSGIDMRLGILAGAVSPDKNTVTKVENIIIDDCKIDDGERAMDVCSYFIGGAVGDMASTYAGYAAMKESDYGHATLRNIYSNVDVDVSTLIREDKKSDGGKYCQFNIGGIIGRVRKGKYIDMPDYTFYTGEVNAPHSFISPTWGQSRVQSTSGGYTNRYTWVAQSYSGEYLPTPSSADAADWTVYLKKDDALNLYDGVQITPPVYTNRLYSDYKIWCPVSNNSSDGDYVDIIPGVTPLVENPVTGTLTLSDHYYKNAVNATPHTNTDIFDITSTDVMAGFQGVNHATYVEPASVNTSVLSMMNSYISSQPESERELYSRWVTTPDGGLGFYAEKKTLKLSKNSASSYVATVYHGDIDVDGELYVTWTDGEGHQLAPPMLTTGHKSEIDLQTLGVDMESLSLVRVELTDAAGTPLAEPVYAEIVVEKLTDSSRLVLDRYVNPSNKDKEVYVATLYDAENNVIMGGGTVSWSADGDAVVTGAVPVMAGYAWFWEVCSTTASLRAWELTDRSHTDSWIQPQSPGRYYRVSWVKDEFSNRRPVHAALAEAVNGPIKTIYVYNKAATIPAYEKRIKIIKGPNRSSGNYVLADKMITSFDGKERYIEIDGTGQPQVVIGEDFPDGDDRNTGYDPFHAVRSMHRAYQLLEAERGMSENKIVVMGYICEESFMRPSYSGLYNKPCIITGKEQSYISGGAIAMRRTPGDTDNLPDQIMLSAATTFRDINWIGFKDTSIFDTCWELRLYCNRNDLFIGDNVCMIGYSLMGGALGLLEGEIVPNITIVGGSHDFNEDVIPQGQYNEIPGINIIELNSGVFARIICGARNNSANHKIFGSYDNPNRTELRVSIKHKDDSYKYEYSPDLHSITHDIGLLAGGQTDGSIFTDTQIYMNAGSVGRFISGNISYGRGIAGLPDDSFFGKTTITLHGGEIEELYGGSLGRMTNENVEANSSAYFYGHSEIILDGAKVNRSIYGSGAGGVSGIGVCEHDGHHTSDQFIPYFNKTGNLVYGSYENVKAVADELGTTIASRIPSMIANDGSTISLAESRCVVRVLSGEVEGDIFGGGYGYSSEIHVRNALPISGSLFGSATVYIGDPDVKRATPPIIKGNVYGGGAGSNMYFLLSQRPADVDLTGNNRGLGYTEEQAREAFGKLARVFGSTKVYIYDGTIYGDVYGAGQGNEGFPEMATVFGNSSVEIDGSRATVMGNIYGGGALASVRNSDTVMDESYSGNTSVKIVSGNIGNNIFGGSKGSDNQTCMISRNSRVDILGGNYVKEADATDVRGNYIMEGGKRVARTFNIYGGGYHNCIIGGNSSVYIERGLLNDYGSLVSSAEEGVPQKDTDEYAEYGRERFMELFDDIAVRHFCVYGAGYGVKTRVNGSSSVEINIKPDEKSGIKAPTDRPMYRLETAQTFFDVAGGGFNGSVGYWSQGVDGEGNEIPIEIGTTPAENYKYYVGGEANVIINGFPYIRKVIGGGFYASVRTANTNVYSGSIGSVYGGALLGYVHDFANLNVGMPSGTRYSDITMQEIDPADGGVIDDETIRERYNSRLFITGDVFGGNDVKGIVGTEIVNPAGGMYEDADLGPLFIADVSTETERGVYMNVFGGTVMGDVYGAGNGHYRGYYVPEWSRYDEGPDRHYRTVRSNISPDGKGRVYRCRPMVGSVKMNIQGNSETDRTDIRGNVFGGGKSCTIGQWDPTLPYEDPRRLVKGGYLHINFGSHVTVKQGVYMGAQGQQYVDVAPVPAGIDVSTFNGSKTSDLNKMGDAAYDHWWWNTDRGCYVPGFPEAGEFDGNYGLAGEHMFRGYLKNIEMNGDVELTFYDDIFVKYENIPDAQKSHYTADTQGYAIDNNGIRIRKHWLPGELAVEAYDSDDVVFTDLFLGGKCGSMSNNLLMRYDYNTNQTLSPDEYEALKAQPDFASKKDNIEEWGSIYRVTLPRNLTINDKVVGGSETATTTIYRFDPASNYHALTDDVMYTFQGGIVTRSCFSYDLLVYNYENHAHLLDWTSELPEGWSTPAQFRNSYTFTDEDGVEQTIHRYVYPSGSDFYIPNLHALDLDRFSLALTPDNHGYIGMRERRPGATAVKLSIGNKFDPQTGDGYQTRQVHDAEEIRAYDDVKHRFGGIIYGGCYDSGVTIGDVIINVGSDMLGNRVDPDQADTFDDISSLKYNLGRVYGGGFGPETQIQGSTYVNLLLNFRGMNIFGGGCRGSITGSTTINYYGSETGSYIYGAIYGGGLQGAVGTENLTKVATNVNLFSGNVDRVYGGSCLGSIFGRTKVEMADEVTTELDHLDFSRLTDLSTIEDWGGSRLIVGTVYGGNDIAGTITLPPAEELPPTATEAEKKEAVDNSYHTTVRIYEIQGNASNSGSARRAEPAEGDEGTGSVPEKELGFPGKTSPGSDNGYNGFPLVGRMYGASNGNYGTHDLATGKYSGGTVEIATGVRNNFVALPLAGYEGVYEAFDIPTVSRARIIAEGGTIINAFAGGDKATVSEKAEINVNYILDPAEKSNFYAHAGFSDAAELTRVWNVMHLEHEEQLAEVTSYHSDGSQRFDNHIHRLFGGNNKADMDIQPTWNLVCGDIGSIYSGGNFGEMTYFNPTPDTSKGEDYGLTLTIDSRNIHAGSVFGGSRVGNINPKIPEGFTFPAGVDFFGATLQIEDGVIDHVYGGNDVSGDVKYGTKVVLHGAISGDVYCAGNGNYRYMYDTELEEGDQIQECYDEDLAGGRYFRLPPKAAYGGKTAVPAQRLLAINSYRPNVDRSSLIIEGRAPVVDPGTNDVVTPAHEVFVRGKVFCGGNSSTVSRDILNPDIKHDIKFTIGSYVTLNSVYFGSNGENLLDADNSMIHVIEKLNDLDLSNPNLLTSAHRALLANDASGYGQRDLDAYDDKRTLYPNLLDLYMRAVEVSGTPSEFSFADGLTEAYIGDFFIGGNRGSMLTDEEIEIEFPENLVIYNKVVGGSNNANVTYKGVPHTGGLTRPLAQGDTKVHLIVRNRFEPWRLQYPVDNDARKIVREADVTTDAASGVLVFPQSKCTIYGGCYNSGLTVGNIRIDLYSDLISDYDADSAIGKALAAVGVGAADGLLNKTRVIVNGIDEKSLRTFAVVGGGYGARTSVKGNIHLRMLPGALHPDYIEGQSYAHPGVSALFGGSQMGQVIGSTFVEVRDGQVLTNTYGASEASPLYGSTHTIIGWPTYWRCKASGRGRYTVRRADNISEVSINNETHKDTGRPLVLKEIYLREGDIISENLFDKLVDADPADFEHFDDITPGNYYDDSAVTYRKSLKWDDINISIGDSHSFVDNTGEFMGHGNVYGGGFAATSTMAGKNSVCSFTGEYTPSADLVGYGGNSNIIIWDNPDNANLDLTTATTDGSALRDHISIGTGRYVKVSDAKIRVGQDVKGYFIYDDNPSSATYGNYIHQASHILGNDYVDANPGAQPEDDPLLQCDFYVVESDGGLYGGGRKVYVEKFRDCDVSYYGYADFSPQFPKLLNTAQRFDILTFRDCCVQFQGATDFAGNSLDATRYSLTRIGELNMESSIPAYIEANNLPLYAGERDNSPLRNTLHTQKRSRNYLSFYNSVQYVSAITSNVAFDSDYYGADGVKWSTTYVDTDGNVVAKPTDDFDHTAYGYAEESATGFSYKDFKRRRINNYQNFNKHPYSGPEDPENPTYIAFHKGKSRTHLEFDQRNVGTSANMIGINNGYTLKVQGAIVNESNGVDTYYGPVDGLFEIKLLTLARNEGGGYIFALNNHDEALDDSSGKKSFLETTGNFVFPGAAYLVSEGSKDYNYINDDCFPMGRGWDYYTNTPGMPDTNGDGVSDCNDQEIHYWYVNGTNFYYNVTLTAFTYHDEMKHTLDSNDQLIFLYGSNPGAKFSVQSVTWSPSDNEESDIQLDLTSSRNGITDGGYDLGYNLFMSIDDNPGVPHTMTTDNRDHAFVVPISRTDYLRGAGADNKDTVADPSVSDITDSTDPNYVNRYSDYDDKENTPLLGFTLDDLVNNNKGREYYEKHLENPEKVTIVLRGRNSDDVGGGDGADFKYTIQLEIRYLLGPTINGYPVIENSALPGEYIYANAFDVDVDLDATNMAVTGTDWFICSPSVWETIVNPDDHQQILEEKIYPLINKVTANPPEPVEGFEHIGAEIVKGDDMQVHIPAYLYRNGWHLIYEVVANRQPFFVQPDVTPSTAENPRKAYTEHLVVHNYHRMFPWDGTSVDYIDDEHGDHIIVDGKYLSTPRKQELNIIEGARIYIENDVDMAYFYTWLKELQNVPTKRTAGGDIINPQYAEGLTVYLMSDVVMPDISVSDVKDLIFRGTFHGNGHTIEMRNNKMFLGVNQGSFYNVGFVSTNASGGANEVNVFGENNNLNGTVPGLIESCFFYNAEDISKGKLIDPANRHGEVVNSFRTSDNSERDEQNGLIVASIDEFHYGEVAYNLNRFYLEERYDRGNADIPGLATLDVAPLVDIYEDGEYRFAKVGNSSTALRTRDVPNYQDFHGIRIDVTRANYNSPITGIDATFHNVDGGIDEDRADRDPLTDEIIVDNYGDAVSYHPNFPDDYIFFGQDLSEVGAFATPEVRTYPGVPTTYNVANRVYRTSGFYGDRVDCGFHFNSYAIAAQPTLTAIDFSGYRDIEHSTGGRLVYRRGRTSLSNTASKLDQQGYYLPMVDHPIWDEMEGIDIMGGVTKNLLIYAPDGIEALEPLVYDRDTEESDIYAHIISTTPKDESTPKRTVNTLDGTLTVASKPEAELLHLVDLNDFNAPIEFEVTGKTWYERTPSVFANGGDAWEGICLPFTPHLVYASLDDKSQNTLLLNHGEITHFYGEHVPEEQKGEIEEQSHEYWLRKFVGVDGDKLLFDRPGSTHDKGQSNGDHVANPQEQTRSYWYSNTYNSIYANLYNDNTTHARDCYNGTGTRYNPYPMLTEGYPYIISFPGVRFYEFDMSGLFYKQMTGIEISKQRIAYINEEYSEQDGSKVHVNTTIKVTDDNPPITFTHDGFKLTGSFKNFTPENAYMKMIDPDDGTNNSYFSRMPKSTAVHAFRVYLETPNASPKPMRITSVSSGLLGDDDKDNPGDEQAADEAMMEYYVEFNELVIVSPFAEPVDLHIYDMNGRLIKMVRVEEGQNRVTDLDSGVYIISDFKFKIF